MQYRLDKRSERQLSALGFGCMRLPKEPEAEKLVLAALDKGINYFDTAYAYSGNEEMLGRIMQRNGIRDRMLIASKLPQSKVRKASDIERFFSTTLQRLQTDHVDYYLMHNVTHFSQWENLVSLGVEDWIKDKKANGAIGQIGFSFHGTLPEFKKVMDAYDWDFVQIQYNYVNEHYQAGREGLEMAAKRGLPVIIMEPLLGGKLADGLPKKAQTPLRSCKPGGSMASWGLRWLWDQNEVTCVLSGMKTPEQLEDNVDVVEQALPDCMSDEEHEAIEAAKAAFQEDFKVPCTGCNYCMPCPKGINIPGSFAAYNESYALTWFTGVFHYVMNAGIQSQSANWASDCINCGKCAKACPQHIDVPAELAKVRRRLEPGIVKPAAALYRKIM